MRQGGADLLLHVPLRVTGALLAAALLFGPAAALAAPLSFRVHTIWFADASDEREDYDRFLECLLEGSTLPVWFEGEAVFENAGSFVVPPPSEPFDVEGSHAFVEKLLSEERLPPTAPGVTPLYMFIVSQPAVVLHDCGRYRDADIGGRRVGIAMVRRKPLCWPGTTVLRNVTQTGMHELSELTDYLLGYAGCSADNSCEGRMSCEDGCQNLVGLACDGAPVNTYTGCGTRHVDGWVVQKLGRAGRARENCLACWPCEFTPCALVPGEEPPPECVNRLPTAESTSGWSCATGSGSLAAWLLLVLLRRRVPR